jgi:citrate synthase
MMSIQKESEFFQAYDKGLVIKPTFWDPTFEDAMTILAYIPHMAGLIEKKRMGGRIGEIEWRHEDWTANFGKEFGITDQRQLNLLRLLISIYCDHDGGNSAAHAAHMVGSTLSDPYRACTACLNANAGPLSG